MCGLVTQLNAIEQNWFLIIEKKLFYHTKNDFFNARLSSFIQCSEYRLSNLRAIVVWGREWFYSQ